MPGFHARQTRARIARRKGAKMADKEQQVMVNEAPAGSGTVAYGTCWRAPDGSEGAFWAEGAEAPQAYWQKEEAQAFLDKIKPGMLPEGYTTFIKEILVARPS